MSASEHESEAGPSRSPSPPVVQTSDKKPQGRKRKAGGDGKKGKIFLEDKVSAVEEAHYYFGSLWLM
jgi:hypothetical protein